MAVSPELFRHTLGRFASGVTVVTAANENTLGGLTVSAFSSVSLDPPLILVCIDKRSSSISLIRESKKFGVNILADDQSDVSNLFASRSDDKFQRAAYRLGSTGVPVLDGTVASMECSLAQEVDAGDHIIFIGHLEEATVAEEKEPLLYYYGKYRELSK